MPGGAQGSEVIRHVGNRRVRISGRFFPQGAGAVVNASNEGKAGWTAARSAQGVFTITLDRRFLKVYPIGSALGLSALAARFLQWGAITYAASSVTIVLNVIDAAAAAQDVAANAQNYIGFELEAVQDTVIG